MRSEAESAIESISSDSTSAQKRHFRKVMNLLALALLTSTVLHDSEQRRSTRDLAQITLESRDLSFFCVRVEAFYNARKGGSRCEV